MSTISLGPFVLTEPIGRGGMGEVWRAHHREQETPVAIKVLTREGARREAYIEAFRNEVFSIARLHHPGVIVLMDYGRIRARCEQSSLGRLVEGSPYIVMELARYGSLEEYARSLRWPELRALLLTMLSALGHAHARGVIHRDLKPQNILLGCGDDDAVKLTDFGLAHAIHEDVERSDLIEPGWGTPAYMAPEQFRGRWRDYGPWTDLYALGVMAYELAVGRLPFEATSKFEMGRSHISKDIPRLFPRFPVPAGFEGWAMRLLQKAPEHRFRRAADAAMQLAKLDAQPALPSTQRFGAITDPVLAPLEQASEAMIETSELDVSLLSSFMARDRQRLEERLDSHPTSLFERSFSEEEQDDAPESGEHLPHLPSFPEDHSETLLPEETIEEIIVPAPTYVPPLPLSWRRRQQPLPRPRLLGAGLGLFGLREPPLIGREAERDLMWEALRQVKATQGARAVLLRGASGVGKSRLARWFAARAHELGAAKVMQARHSPMRSPLDGVAPMIARHMGCGGLKRADTYERVRHHLEHIWVKDELDWALLSEVLSPQEHDLSLSATRPYSDAERNAVLTRYFEHEAVERPLIIWLDDIQWGAGSLILARELFEHAATHAMPVLLLMTLREDALESRSMEAHLLAELEHDPMIYQCHLSPLQHAESRELMSELLALEEQLATQLARRARGNPLFAIQLLAQLVNADKLEPGEQGFALKPGESIELPDDIHSLWQARLDRLLVRCAAEQRQCLEMASALGVQVLLTEWMSACAHHSLQVDHALLEDLFEQGLVHNTADGWAFSHGLLRESLERRARDEGRWQRLNRACAEMMLSLYRPSHPNMEARYARYLVVAGEHERALEPMLGAVRLMIRRSDLQGALELLEEREVLLQQLMLPLGDSRSAQGVVLRAQILDEQGAYLDARRWARSVMEDASKYGWRRLHVEACIQCARATFHRGETREARQLYDEAMGALDELHESLREPFMLRIEIGRARIAQRGGEHEEARAQFVLARERAVILGDKLALATTLNGLGDVARQRSELGDARRYAERALEITQEIGNYVLIADCTNDLAEVARLEGDLEGAREYAERAVEYYESVGSSQSMRVRRNLGFIALGMEQFEQAAEIFSRLLAHFGLTHDHSQLAMALVGNLPCLAYKQEWEALEVAMIRAKHLLHETQRHDPDVSVACEQVASLANDARKVDIAARALAIGREHGRAR